MKKSLSSRLKRSIDFWSIPHFLFGSVMALVAASFEYPFPATFAVTLVVAILWERFEQEEGIKESIHNRMADVVLPLIAFVATYFYTHLVAIEHERRIALLTVVTLVFFLVNYLGWRARAARDRDFMN
ncbi:MAG: hypothetical protein WCL23_03405 [Candidatus Moraniibacteriota bacterium]